MKPATRPRDRDQTRLLIVDPELRRTQTGSINELPAYLSAGDVLVMNDAATLPASLQARTERAEAIEIRLLGPNIDGVFPALLFGAGDYHTRTEERAAPPELAPGARLWLNERLQAQVVGRSSLSARLIELRFDREGRDLWRELYAHGKPVQYAYQTEPLALWSVQTLYAARPWAVEMPSAGRPLSFATLVALKQRGVVLATLTHAAGLSSSGEAHIDRLLPLPERYHIPEATVQTLRRATGRVIAVGTSVVRALESAALRGAGQVVAGEAMAELRIDASFEPRVVTGLLTGMHTPEESHYDLLAAFVERSLLERSLQDAHSLGFVSHEFGDACLILPAALAHAQSAA